MVILYQVFEPTLADLTDSFNQVDLDRCGFVTWEEGMQVPKGTASVRRI
jgi:hypothetical protein